MNRAAPLKDPMRVLIANQRVLRRVEAEQMAQDLMTAIENVIELGECGDARTTVETLSLLKNARDNLNREMSWAAQEAAAGGAS